MNEKMSLLIVDDREDNLLILRSLVKEHFPDVVIFIATNADDGLRIASEQHVAGALIDVQMPGVDGIELCRRLKSDEKTRHIASVLLTSHRTTPELRVRGLEAGADDFIHRPFDNLEFVARVKVMFRIKKAEDELRQLNECLEERVLEETRKLRQSEEKFRQIAELLPELVYECDMEGRITFANNYAFEKLGYTMEDFDKRHHSYHFVAEGDRERAKENLTKRLQGMEDGPIEYMVLRKDGSEFPVISYASLIVSDSKTVGLRGLAVDITERKQAEEERTKIINQLDSKNQEMTQLLYVTSHDLRSPLVSIEGFSGILGMSLEQILSILEKEELSSEICKRLEPSINNSRESIDYIRQGVTKMSLLLKGLSQISRVGRVDLKKKELDMNTLILEALSAVKFLCEEEQVQIEVADLPKCHGDKVQISQLFTNLFSNAIKYADPGRSSVLKISGQEKDGHSVYCVEDNGIGIAREYQEKIFELFHQLNPSVEGEGLGLNIASKIMEKHNGKIWVDSELGKGTRFYISL